MTENNRLPISNSFDSGLLLLRIGIGCCMALHGFPKLLAGPPAWERLGNTMALLGIEKLPLVWGLLAGLTEVIAGIMLIVGIFTNLALFLLSFTMVMALGFHLNKGDDFLIYSHALELFIVFASLILVGPGRYSIDHWSVNRSEVKPQPPKEPDVPVEAVDDFPLDHYVLS